MEIKFYRIADDRRKVQKTLNDSTLVKTATGDIKSDCSVMDPIIEMSIDVALLQCNYMYIEDFGRYYHITNIETGAQRLFVHAHVDVLQTYAQQILQLDCIIARQESENKSNLYLNDGMWRNLQIKRYMTFGFPKQLDSTGSFVIAVGGDM